MNSREPLDQFRRFLCREAPKGQYSPETERLYLGQVEAWFQWCDERNLRVRSITHDHVRAYRDHLIQQGYASNTVCSRIISVRQFYKMIQVEENRRDNPASKVRTPRDLRDPDQRVPLLTLPEVGLMLNAPSSYSIIGIRDRAILGLLGLHGPRRCEIVNLKIDDLDMEGRLIDLVGKAQRRRRIYLVDESARRLERWLEVRQGVAAPRETAVFVATHGGGNGGPGQAMSTTSMNRLVDKYYKALGLKRPGLGTRAFRHAYISWCLALGALIHAVARQVGHADPRTTLIYSHTTKDQNPAKLIADLLFPGQ